MIKRKIDAFIADFYKTQNHALMITGARQIGKTFSIRRFGETFEHFIEINFIENTLASAALKNATSAKDFLLKLSTLTTTPLIPHKTLIFLDEIQECPEAVSMIKFLVEEGSYRYILSGSLLGVELKDLRSEPVGFLSIKEMFPLDLEEFVRAIGLSAEVLATLKKSWDDEIPVDNYIHLKMMELFRLYLIVGGMPAAVVAYLESNNLQKVLAVHKDIITMYKRDISKYDKSNKLQIQKIFDLIPPELNDKNKRFFLRSLRDKMRFNKLEDSFLWLTNAGVAIAAYNVEEPRAPLLLAQSSKLFKLFSSDVGLLAAQYANGIQLQILQGDKAINYGSVYENFVAQELHTHNLKPYYYNSKKRGELDFVVEINGEVVPIEVKSGKDYNRHRALSNILDCKDYSFPKAIVFTNDNLKKDGPIVYTPIYMTMFLAQPPSPVSYYKINLDGVNKRH